MQAPFSLYLHIPYCKRKCPYCDFNVYAVRKIPEVEYVEALCSEIAQYALSGNFLNRRIQTIFFGGGTPSLFNAGSFEKILTAAGNNFGFEGNIEISLEANPSELTADKLKSFRQTGINRLSIGAQSFSGRILKLLGRDHSAETTRRAFQQAREAEFKNISLDLIFAIPTQQLSDVENDLSEIKNLNPDHFSAYGLTIEKGTSFYNSQQRGELKLPDDELAIEMMDLIETLARGSGFFRYEISNYAKPGFYSRHNWAYWSGDDYLGIGAGSHSYLKQNDFTNDDAGSVYAARHANIADHHEYIKRMKNGSSAVCWTERINKKSACFEYFFTGLRKTEGVPISKFENLFKTDFHSKYERVINQLQSGGLVEIRDDMICLTRKGIYLADSVQECWNVEG